MTALNDAARPALTAGNLAHRVTLNADGSAQLSMVWVGLEDEESSARTVSSARRCAIFAAIPGSRYRCRPAAWPAIGLPEYLVVHGQARITEAGAPELLQRLA